MVKVAGSGSGRVSITGLVCLKPGRRGRLVWRVISHRGRKGERSSFSEADYAALLDNVHQRLGTPIVLVWDNLNTHVSAAMRTLIEARDWLTVIRLPAYAPDLNPTEGVWDTRNEAWPTSPCTASTTSPRSSSTGCGPSNVAPT